ncbi:hypothetical protein [Macrococcus equipercicus]|uniref:hypothetical protein n=1 Tax=Macrococcus equipercicus TaxID=69967 RepID=UPI00147949B3|nr:hypothetical protein [Macrococcus equipercicus]
MANSGYRIQGRVTEEQYEFYKDIKKQYIMQTGEAILDGQFIIRMLEEWENSQKNKKK